MNDLIKDYIGAVASGNLVEAKKKFGAIMENRCDVIKAELRVEIAEAVIDMDDVPF